MPGAQLQTRQVAMGGLGAGGKVENTNPGLVIGNPDHSGQLIPKAGNPGGKIRIGREQPLDPVRHAGDGKCGPEVQPDIGNAGSQGLPVAEVPD